MTKFGFVTLAIMACILAPAVLADPTAGWTPEEVSYKVHWPYDVPQSTRFSLNDNVFHLWVFNNDKPLRPGNTTKPRTELRFPDYTSGAQQYEADLMVPSGTAGTCIMQIHTGDDQSAQFGATTFMLFVEPQDGGSLYFYSKQQLAHNVYDQWFHLNVIHDLGTGLVTVYLNNQKAFSTHDQQAGDYYMKTGVYGQAGETKKMEVFIKNLRLWSK
ncbi:MAG TPA: polysaccharide lyase family 7 protein [Opitutaceae bacterium]|jgi:hypothetical protein|nr:polysaccharide lyase family 7 protein [Opitutaceae bacterium]